MADLKTTITKTFALATEIESLFRISMFDSYGDLGGLQIHENDSNERFLIDELQWIMCRLEEAGNRIDYLKRPVEETSYLHKNANGRYETASGYVYTSGNVIEVLIDDGFYEEPYWIRTRVEHDGQDYYLVNHKDIGLAGQASLTASLGYSQPDQMEVTLATIMEKVIDGKPLSAGEGILHHSENIDLIPANIDFVKIS